MKQDHVFIAVKPLEDGAHELCYVRTSSTGVVSSEREESYKISGGGANGTPEAKKAFNEAQTVVDALRNAVKDTGGKFVVVAHDARATDARLAQICKSHGSFEYPFGNRAWLDLRQMTWPLVHGGFVKDRTLKAVADHCGVKCSDKPSVEEEVHVVRETYFVWIERVVMGARVEELGRNLIGELGSGLMRFAGKFAGQKTEEKRDGKE